MDLFKKNILIYGKCMNERKQGTIYLMGGGHSGSYLSFFFCCRLGHTSMIPSTWGMIAFSL